MLDLTSTSDGTFIASARPWINILGGLVSRLWMGIVMLASLSAPTANAQVQTPFATGVTEPIGGLVLSGTTINPFTGNPYRHLWTTDQAGFGMCRLDPDVDTPGPHTINPNTCIPFIGGVHFKPGQLAFDPLLNNIYAVDLQVQTQGIFRLHFVPGGDSGHGALDLLHVEVLGGTSSVSACGIPGNIPNSAVLGPDGNLYIGFKHSGNILRVIAPQTEPLPCANVQVIGTTADQTKDFGLGWIGHDLYGGDGIALWIMTNADVCMTPQNGLLPCRGISILQSETALPSFVISDQIYPATNGVNLFIGNPQDVTLINTVTLQATPNYASGFSFLGGLTIDPTNMALYVADDPAAGKLPAQGRWFYIGNGPANGGRAPGTLTLFASGVTAPIGGVIIAGSAINPNTNQPYRHFWTSDSGGLGLCRLDPDMDSPPPHTINPTTCMATVAGTLFKPGELAFDPLLNNLYAVDIQANTQGIFRLHYLPDGDSGHGALDPLHAEVLGGNPGAVHQTLPADCGIPGNIPNSAVLGPDGNLYIGFKASGDILRVTSPQTEPLPCQNVQVIGTTPDNKKDFGLGWIGHDLLGGDGTSAWIMVGADVCVTSLNPESCQSTNILVGQTAAPTYVMTDQFYPAQNGRNLFVGQPGAITLVDTLNLKVTMNYATGFQFLSGMALDPTNLSLYAADDPTAGKVNGQGHWWAVGQQQITPTIPGTPTRVGTIAGDQQAAVDWTPASDGQQVTSYTVRNSFASNGFTIPDTFIGPISGTTVVSSTTVITGLTNGVGYQFTVAATNSLGTSAFSAPSNLIVPQALTPPSSPIGVAAAAGNASATVSWNVPVSNGGSAILNYRVTALSAGAPVGIGMTVAAPNTSATVSGLANGTAYTFVVQAVNSTGDSPASAPSNTVTPQAPPAPGVANLLVTISGPNALPPNSSAGYQITVTNLGNSTVSQVIVADSFTTSAASVFAATPSQGTCVTAALVSCNFGSIPAGATVGLGVTENLTDTTINVVVVSALDGNGHPMTIATPANGTANITTTVTAPPPPSPTPIATPTPTPTPIPTPTPTPSPTPTPTPTPTPAVVTDLALNGSYIDGAGSGTITWQVTNLGSVDATGVILIQHLPAALKIQSIITTPGGFCEQSPAFANSTRLGCGLNTLPAGQSWSINISVVSSASVVKTAALVSFRGTDPVTANNYSLVTMHTNIGGNSGSGGAQVPKSQPSLQFLNLSAFRKAISEAGRILSP